MLSWVGNNQPMKMGEIPRATDKKLLVKNYLHEAAGSSPVIPTILKQICHFGGNICGRGGIGRRTSLRGWREQSRGGSSPPDRTKSM